MTSAHAAHAAPPLAASAPSAIAPSATAPTATAPTATAPTATAPTATASTATASTATAPTAPTATSSTASDLVATSSAAFGPSTGPGLAGLSNQPFSVEADRLTAEVGTRRYVAEGRVLVRRPGAVLFADRVVFDEAAGEAIAEGNVTAIDGTTVLSCDRVRMRIPELVGGIEGAELRIKAKDPNLHLLTRSSTVARRAGRDELIVEAESLQRRSASKFEVGGASFTACDCGDDARPSWRIRARSADIDLESGAWLSLPVFYVLDVPVFALPLFYVPLGPRRTGLLTPRFGYMPNAGFRVGLPVFIVLSRSWDLTLEPFYLSERGGGANLELRYAPSHDTSGAWRPSVVVDVGERVDGDWAKSGDPIVRYALSGTHDTRWADARLRADVNVMGDPNYQADFADAFLTRQAELSRSRLTYGQRFDDRLRFTTGLQLLQDLRSETYADPTGTRELRQVALLSGELPGPGTVRYRWFDAVLDAAPGVIAEAVPVLAQARLSVSAFSAPRPEVARFVRADLRPELSAPIQLPLGLVLEPSIAGRFTAWAGRFEGASVSGSRLAAVARTRLHLDLVRDFCSVVHRIRPSIEHVIVPGLGRYGDDVFEARDEVDLLARVHQVRGRLDTELVDPRSGARWAGLTTWLGRDLDFLGHAGRGNSELVVQADVSWDRPNWPVRVGLTAHAAVRVEDPALTEVQAAAEVASRRGDALTVTYGRFDPAFPRYTLIGPEELVPAGTVDPAQYIPFEQWSALPGEDRGPFRPWSGFDGLTVSARARPFEPLTLAFDIGLAFDAEEVIAQVYGDQGSVSVVRNTRAAIQWDSPCKCWGGYVSVATARDREGVQVDVGFDLARLGGVGLP